LFDRILFLFFFLFKYFLSIVSVEWLHTFISVKVRCSRSTLLFRSILKDKAFFFFFFFRYWCVQNTRVWLMWNTFIIDQIINVYILTHWKEREKWKHLTRQITIDLTDSMFYYNVDLILTKKSFSRCQEHK
jgi:hypothetical protein